MTVKVPAKEEARRILAAVETRLADEGSNSARSDARCLVGLAIGRDEPVLPHEYIPALDRAAEARLNALIARRLQGEPISRMRGWREFWSLRFLLSPDTLDPRPDSETLVEAACGWARQRALHSPQILDLGTGSGCLLLAVLSELKDAVGTGLDLAGGAVATARMNADHLGLAGRADFRLGDFTADLTGLGGFTMILSNPPYIPRAEIDRLAPDVRLFDPLLALDGGDDGLDVWRRLLPQIKRLLRPDGAAFVEIGKGQEAPVLALAAAAGLDHIGSFRDLAGIIRCLGLAIKI